MVLGAMLGLLGEFPVLVSASIVMLRVPRCYLLGICLPHLVLPSHSRFGYPVSFTKSWGDAPYHFPRAFRTWVLCFWCFGKFERVGTRAPWLGAPGSDPRADLLVLATAISPCDTWSHIHVVAR